VQQGESSAEVEASEGEADRWTSIRVKKQTAERLKHVGRKGETYDEIIRRLLERASRRRRR